MLLKRSYLALDMTSKKCVQNKEQVLYKACVKVVASCSESRCCLKRISAFAKAFMLQVPATPALL